MEERATPGVLTRDTNSEALFEQARIGQRLSAAPIKRQLARDHLGAIDHHLLHTRMQRKPVGELGDALAKRLQTLNLDTGVHAGRPIDLHVGRPVDGVFVADHAERGACLRPTLIEACAILLNQRIGIGYRQNTLGCQTLRIELARRRMLADDAVHHRLRGSRFVRFVVPETAITDEINHDILVEALAIAHCHPSNENHGLGIIAIDVEDRRFEHLGDVGAIHRRTHVLRLRGREPHLIIDDEVNRAASVVTTRLRQLQRLHHHTLTTEG